MPTAVLFSGGLDSAVLLWEEASRDEVQPIYVSTGLAWESAERGIVDRVLASMPYRRRVRSLVSLTVDMRDVYGARHWAIDGCPPGYQTADEGVYLPGRNIVLLSKAGIYCAAVHLDRLVMGTLAHNPFPDATPGFRTAMMRVLSLGMAHPLQIDAPYAEMSKAQVIRRGAAIGIPLALTLSCMNPRLTPLKLPDSPPTMLPARTSSHAEWHHCGRCNKCRERHDAFLKAAIPDPTMYADTTNLA